VHLTPEDIEKVRTKNIANLLRLANSGKPLNRAQQAELESYSYGGRRDGVESTAYAKTQDELAGLLCITRKTIGNCLRKFKSESPPVPVTRADGRYDVLAWAAFLRAHNIAHKAEDGSAVPTTPESGGEASQRTQTVIEWKQEKLRLECERIRLEIAKTEGQLVQVIDVESRLGVMLSAFRTAANNLPGRASQKLIGLRDYHDIEEILSAEIAIMLRTLEACPFLEDQGETLCDTKTPEPPTVAKRPDVCHVEQSWDDVGGEKTPGQKKKPSKVEAPGSLLRPGMRRKKLTSAKKKARVMKS
jgi:hypothetical protein